MEKLDNVDIIKEKMMKIGNQYADFMLDPDFKSKSKINQVHKTFSIAERAYRMVLQLEQLENVGGFPKRLIDFAKSLGRKTKRGDAYTAYLVFYDSLELVESPWTRNEFYGWLRKMQFEDKRYHDGNYFIRPRDGVLVDKVLLDM